jgi:hypothetical protein
MKVDGSLHINLGHNTVYRLAELAQVYVIIYYTNVYKSRLDKRVSFILQLGYFFCHNKLVEIYCCFFYDNVIITLHIDIITLFTLA